MVASIATRECLSSDARNQRRVSSDPTVERDKGSKVFNGAVFPGMLSRPIRRAELACTEVDKQKQ